MFEDQLKSPFGELRFSGREYEISLSSWERSELN